MIATGLEEGVPTRRGGQGPADWQEVHKAVRSIVERIPRTAARQHLEEIADKLSHADDELSPLKTHIKAENMSTKETQFERHTITLSSWAFQQMSRQARARVAADDCEQEAGCGGRQSGACGG